MLKSVPLWSVSLVLPLVLVGAWAVSGIARVLLRGRARLATSAGIVIAILGTAAAAGVAGVMDSSLDLLSLPTLLLSLVFSTVGIALYAAIAAHFQPRPSSAIETVLAAGESRRVEFKSTARVNLHTGAKDERMEQVIAKTVAAFLNADGGTLVIGVDDTGTPVGLDADLDTMKAPDLDRYELWLRDLLTTTLGQNPAALVRIEFPTAADADKVDRPVCLVSVRPSPRPVYLMPGKSAAPEFWVRSGNSTRQLRVDEATDYVMHRWPLGFGANLAAQMLAAVRFSEAG